MKESTSAADSPVRLLPRWTQQDWMDEAACKGQTEHFFAPHGEQADAREVREALARAICVTCSVLLPCREYARRHREQGYWGAENDDQRLDVRRRRSNTPASAPASVPSYARSAQAN